MALMVRTPHNRRAIATWTPYPRHLVVLGHRDTAVQRLLERGGLAGHRTPTQAALLALVQLAPIGAVVFDVGANIGLSSALVDMIFAGKDVHVTAFEPTPATAEMARLLRRQNRLSYEVVELALAGRPGPATLYASSMDEGAGSLHPDDLERSDQPPVEVTTLDAYTKLRRIDPHVIKIDAAADGPGVLAGGYATIQRARPAIICGVRDPRRADEMAPQLDRLYRLGYRSYSLSGTLPWRRLDPRDTHRLTDGHRCHDWLLLPRKAGRALGHATGEWLAAVGEFDQSTNLRVRDGIEPPAETQRGYPSAGRQVSWGG